jgi:hypothetical protein
MAFWDNKPTRPNICTAISSVGPGMQTAIVCVVNSTTSRMILRKFLCFSRPSPVKNRPAAFRPASREIDAAGSKILPQATQGGIGYETHHTHRSRDHLRDLWHRKMPNLAHQT